MKKVNAIPQHIKATNKFGIEEYVFPFTTEEEVLLEGQTMTLKQRLDEIGAVLDQFQSVATEKTGIIFKDKDGGSTILSNITFSEIE